MKIVRNQKPLNEIMLNEMKKDSLMAYNHMNEENRGKFSMRSALVDKGLILVTGGMLALALSLVLFFILN